MDGIHRVPLDVDLDELAERITLCYTGEPHDSGTNNWEITKRHIDGDPQVFECFERIRDTAVADARGPRAGRLGRRGPRHRRRMGEPPAPGPGRDHARHRRSHRARPGRGRYRRQGVRRRGRRVPVLLRSARPGRPTFARRSRPAGRACSTTASSGRGSCVDNAAIARALGDIADLLEIKGENAFKIRAYRSAADVVQTSGEQVARLTDAQLRALPGIGKDLSARIRELAETGTCAPYRELMAGVSADHPRPAAAPGRRAEDGGPALPLARRGQRGRAERRGAGGPAARAEGHGAEEGVADPQGHRGRARARPGRHLLADAAALADDIITSLVAAHPSASVLPVGSLRRGVETCGDVDLLCTGAEGPVMDTFVTHPRVERGARPRRHQVERACQERRPGGPAASCPPRAAARRCSTSPARRPTTSSCGTARCTAG